MVSNNEYIAELFYNTLTGLYDLYLTTFNGSINIINFKFFFCERKHIGRMDLVSNDIYNDTKWVGSLCMLNDIMNPFSIRDGDILVYLPETELQNQLKVSVNQTISNVKIDLIKSLKKKKPDALRKKYIDNRGDDKLPPTIFDETSPQIVLDNNKIKISPNLFSIPTPIATPQTLDTPNNSNIPQASEDDIQRVLVRRYIKTAND